ncbi:RNase3 domain-containing protein [Colletotrichum karsti]|uniref:RNase3 domain-containing protein n=1 Tax=Colletotrichum karsti TaxID=1095194 RepID=A0A9P6I6D5_9PEZI|nr:RNase3 domain-containing protein [Colletotrichum karsti]KAF9877722.1 RNase3 domain-containing protein [Colletotrichum karsti]
MSKRSNSGVLPPSKRRHTDNDAVESLVSHSKELIECLQALTGSSKSGSSTKDDALQKLRGLSKTLLPSFQYLARDGDPRDELEKPEPKEIPREPSLAGVPVPSFSIFKPWTSADIPKVIPPLPKITNHVLETAAFTHVGRVKNRGDLSYDRLEWLGDAYVELFSTCLIFQTFGGLSTGRCSQMRELLIKNANLGEYSVKYQLFERAILPPEYDPNNHTTSKSKPQEIQKVKGDLFEAYVAAVVLSDADGLSRAVEWLRSLWAMTIQDQIRTADNKPDIRMVKELGTTVESSESQLLPKVQLLQLIGAKGVQIRYEDLPSKPDKYNKKLSLFSVGVYLDGWGEKNKLLGIGNDRNKKEAGQKAATAALENKKLMKTYAAKKAALYAALGNA